jgi:hypothetical protein
MWFGYFLNSNHLEHEGDGGIPGWSLENTFRDWKVDGIGSESYSVPGFDISGIEPLDSITGELVRQNSDFRCLQFMFLQRVRGYDSQPRK